MYLRKYKIIHMLVFTFILTNLFEFIYTTNRVFSIPFFNYKSGKIRPLYSANETNISNQEQFIICRCSKDNYMSCLLCIEKGGFDTDDSKKNHLQMEKCTITFENSTKNVKH